MTTHSLPQWLSLMLSSLVLGCISFFSFMIAKALAPLFSSSCAAPPQAPYLETEKAWNGLPKSYSRYMEHGHRKFKNTMFSVPTDSGPLIILPQKFVDEVKTLSDKHANFRNSFEFWFLNAHTNIGGQEQHQLALIHAAKHHLTKHRDLEKLLGAVQEELEFAFKEELPQTADWKEVKIYPIMIRIVARLIARVFVGRSLCRDPDYLDISITYTVNCLRVSRTLAWCPQYLRPILKFAVPGYLALRYQEKRMQQLLKPITQERVELQDDEDKPMDLLQWFVDASTERQRKDDKFLAISQINASLAAIHSTAIVATNALFDAATRPECVEELREEISTSSETNTYSVANMDLLKLPKLDSFMKESQRMNPLGLTTDSLLFGIMRMSTSDVKLSDGSISPCNSQFAFAMNSTYRDNSVYENANQFDAFRFQKHREQASDASESNKWQFVSSNNQSYSFGYGSHACPGRHFAAMELKVILANLLTKFDFQGDSFMEYQTGIRGFMFLPDVDKKLSIRLRSGTQEKARRESGVA